MVDATGTWRIPEKYDEVGKFRGDLAKSLALPEFLPGVNGAKIRKWLKAEGSEVKGGEPLAVVDLTEPALPVEAPVSGMLVKIGVPAGGAAIPGASIGIVRVLGKIGIFAKKQIEVECPGYGPNPGSATVVRWIKEEGDAVIKGEKIAEIRPEQAMAMIQSPGTGTLVKIEVKDGEEAKVGQGVARMGIGRVAVKMGGEWFYTDERGTRVTQDHYDEVGAMPGGMAAVKVKDRWGYVACAGGELKMAIAPRFLQARDFSEGLAAVEESDDAPVTDDMEVEQVEAEKSGMETKPELAPAWGYIIPSGKLWGKLDFAEVGNFLDGRAAVRTLGEGTLWVLIDSKIKARTTGNYSALVLLGAHRVAWRRDGGWGLMDLQEKVVDIKPGLKDQDVLGAVGPFESGRAPAKEVGGKWGYLDVDGKWAIPAKFERAGIFRGGLAAVKEVGGKWGYIKPDGSWGMEPKFSRARAFSDGLAAVSEQGEVESGPELETGGVWE